jgi:hypothetical protein
MCSIVKWSDNNVAVVVARNMDYMKGMKSDTLIRLFLSLYVNERLYIDIWL